jgi:hypothetical protein
LSRGGVPRLCDALVAAGVPSDIIEIAYHGANNPLAATPRGVGGAAQQARRGNNSPIWASV